VSETLLPAAEGVAACRMVDLPSVRSEGLGELSFIEAERHVPFDIRRVYYLYDVPAGGLRGGHAHVRLQQLLVAVSGSLDVVVNDGRSEARFRLLHRNQGLYLPRMVWRDLENFSGGAVCIVLASEHFDESDYIRSWDDFAALVGVGPRW
jgi:dTDP-4-dehydrorhamnose 3,5-epimerase-like enzyme